MDEAWRISKGNALSKMRSAGQTRVFAFLFKGLMLIL
jgi:hypothetical protein